MANRFLSNISINDAYTFPASDGTSGQVITTDGSGNLSFSDASTESNFVYYTVKNSSGSTINKGAAVMAVGTDGNSGHILIDEMVADGSVEPKFFMGVLETTLANGEIGRVIHFGELSQFNTSAFEDGDILWCDPATPGGFTVTEPLGPNVKIAAAIVINASTNGKIKVRVQANEGLHELHDVRITSQGDGEVLVWDNTLGVWKNNSTLIVDHADGRVGIGESSPLAKAHVKSGSSGIAGALSSNYDDFAVEGSGNTGITILSPNSNNCGIAFGDEDATFQGLILYRHSLDVMSFSVGGTERMRIDSSANLAVGTTTVTANLDLAADDIVNGVTLRLKNIHNGSDWGLDSKLGVIDFYSTDASAAGVKGAIELIQSSASTTNPSATDLVFKTYGGGSVSEKMRINSSGYVGIGEESPDYPLHISSTFGFPVLIERTNAADAGIRFKDSTTTDADQVRLGARGNDLQILTGGSESIRINSLGRVGIGTTDPNRTLSIVGQIGMDGGSAGMLLSCDADSNKIYSRIANNSTTAHPFNLVMGSTSAMYVTSDSKVGIGTTTPSSKLQVDGDFNITNKYIYNQGYTSTTGAGVANGTTIEWKSGITTINTAYNYRIRLTTAGTGTNSGSTYLVEYNPDTTTYNVRMVSRSGSDSNHPLLAMDGATMVAYTNLATAYPIQYHVEAIAVSDNDGTLHNMGADYHWQRDVNDLFYEDGNVGIGTGSPKGKLHSWQGDSGQTTANSVANGLVIEDDSANGISILTPSTQAGNIFFGDESDNFVGGIRYYHTNDSLAFSANNAERFRIDANGSIVVNGQTDNLIGTGTSDGSDDKSITISSGTSASSSRGGYATFYGNEHATLAGDTYVVAGNITGAELRLHAVNATGFVTVHTAGAEKMRVDAAGNVGIGTASPSSTLEISQQLSALSTIDYPLTISSRDDNNILNQLGGEGVGIRFRIAGNEATIPGDSLVGASIAAIRESSSDAVSNTSLAFFVSQDDQTLDEAIRISSSGNVGIGTDTPTANLHIKSTGDATLLLESDSDNLAEDDNPTLVFSQDGGSITATLGLEGNAGTVFPTSGSNGFYIDSTEEIMFGTNNVERMRIDASGNVGIGTDSINGRLNIKSSDSGTYLLNLDYSNGIDGGGFYQSAGTGLSLFLKDSSASTKVQIATEGDTYFNGGSVGIGTTTPKARLDLNGTIAFDSKSMSISDTFATALTINMTQHRGCYVKITAFGDWSSHSSVAYLGEFFIQHGADGYKEPGTIIRQVDNTYADSIEAKIVDPAGGSVNKDFTIQLRATASADTPFTIYLQYEVRGQFNSVS